MIGASDTLVSTKLRPSQTRPNLVARPRLIAKLEREAGRKLTLISAPAGFGKTTLLAEWLENHATAGRLAAWVSLDEGDNDPVRFLSYLVAALQTVREGVGEGVLSTLRSPQPPRIDALVGALINEIASSSGEIDLVLDDYHLIDSEVVHGTVSFLLEYLPPNMHLVISGRVDPPLPISRLRARGQMAKLGAAELRFTPEEATAFVNDLMGLGLSAEDVAALERRTEGWIAGLQLAALSMRDRKDVSGFVRAFSGSHRDVLDYLAEEVLERQPEQVRNFLLETSVLDHLSGALCDALTGRSDGQEMLERLEKDNLFVVALDDERRWYRYHRLFADFLRNRLEREEPGRIPELHRRVAAWYEANGWASEAVEHALAAEDYERAADLVELAANESWYRGEVLTLLGWLETLPERVMRRRPGLLLQYAGVLTWIGRLDDAEPLVREVERVVGREGRGEDPRPDTDESLRQLLLGGIAAIRSWHARLKGESHRAIALAGQALELLPDGDPSLRVFAAFRLAEAYRTADDLEAASAAFGEIVRLGWAGGHDYVALEAMGSQARLQLAQGRLREACDILQRSLRLAAEREGGASRTATGEAHVAMGELLYEWDDLGSAEDRLTEGMELAERMGKFDTLVDGYVALSRVERAWGDLEGALETAREAEQLARRAGVGEAIVEAAVWRARLHLTMGDLATAAFEQKRATSASGGIPPAVRETERIALARLLVARGEYDEALRLLPELREAAKAAGRMGNAIEILALEAIALRVQDDKEQAVNTLAQALALAEPEGYVRTFVDEGPVMAALLSEALAAQQRGRLAPDVPVHYLRKLSAALERDASGGAATPSGAELPEPLSERELEVLILIAAGKSNREIAKELFVAQSTVKTHVKNIYRKLDAHTRTQALARAKELGLL